MIAKTLFEKLDNSCMDISLKESVCNQVQRIISTRVYLGDKPKVNSWVTGFGIPEVVGESANVGDAHAYYREIIRKKILEFEPRIIDVKVEMLNNYSYKASCRLVMQLKEGEIQEQFFF